MISVEKPGTPEDLIHFGVKGMRWGVRRSAASRRFYAENPTSAERTAAIGKARISSAKTKLAYKSEKDKEKRKELKALHLKNPDTATALRLTKGEKIVSGLLVGLVPTVAIPAAVAGSTAYRVGRRRALEK